MLNVGKYIIHGSYAKVTNGSGFPKGVKSSTGNFRLWEGDPYQGRWPILFGGMIRVSFWGGKFGADIRKKSSSRSFGWKESMNSNLKTASTKSSKFSCGISTHLRRFYFNIFNFMVTSWYEIIRFSMIFDHPGYYSHQRTLGQEEGLKKGVYESPLYGN